MDNFKTLLVSSVFGFLFLLIAGTTQAEAKTIYVATNGNDGNAGTLSAPVASPKQALNLAIHGDTIQFRAGRYTVTSGLWVWQNNLTISSYPGEKAALQGGTADAAGNPQSVMTIVSNYVTVTDLEVQGGVYYGIKIDIDSNPNTTGVVIRRCYVHHTGRDAIKTLNADGLLIEDCEISNTGVREDNAEGIDSIGSKGVTIRRCYIHDVRTTGIYLKGGASNGLVEGCRIVNAGNSGLLFGQDTDPEYMRDGTPYEAMNCIGRNNIIASTAGAGIGTYSGSNIRFENNTVYDVARTYHGGFHVVMNNSDQPARQVSFKNNILVMFSQRPIAVVIGLADPLVCDSNIYFRPAGGNYNFTREDWKANLYEYWSKLSDWQSKMGVDGKSVIADPQLDAASLYKPAATSPAIDRGEALSGVAADYAGTARPQGGGYDIGAHERTGSGTTTPPANKPPQVNVTASVTSGLAPLGVTFTTTASDPDGKVASYSWQFGDGQTATQASPFHSYQSAGNFTARVTVTDNAGATASATVLINVTTPAANQSPKVTIKASTTTGLAPLAVQFTATGSDVDGQVVAYSWDFGDGGTATTASASRTYQKAGSYTARVTVRDNAGATATASVVINASDATGSTVQDVVWKNVVNARVSGNTVTKTTFATWGNSGAASQQAITSGNGYLEFTAVETSNERMCGLSNSDADQHYRSIAYAIQLNTGRSFYVYEKGVSRGYFGDFNTGDKFRVAVEQGVVKYYRNGSMFYMSSVKPAYPLMADAALMGENSAIDKAVMGGIAAATGAVVAPAVALSSPNDGEIVQGNSTFTITWSVKGTNIWRQDVSLSVDGGITWSSIDVMLPGSADSCTWVVPNLKTAKARIRVVAYGAGEVSAQDTSDQNFSIAKAKTRLKSKKLSVTQ